MSPMPERDHPPAVPTPITPVRGRLTLALAPIPVPLTKLVGREREIEAATAMTRRDDVRLVALTGPGGVGKTRLAIAVALEVAPHFADGVAYVELAAIRDQALVGPTIAQALGIGGAEGGQVVERLATYLHQRELLLVLDNFEQVVEAAPILSHLLRACSGLKVLVTSRSVLRVSGEWNVAVPPLPLPEPEPEQAFTPEALYEYPAIRLFVERARAATSAFALTDDNAWAIAAICRRLDGLPLAIELVAPRMRVFTPIALAVRLNASLPLLIDGPRDLPERQRTMRKTVAWSVDLLGSDNTELFFELAVFSGGFTLEAAEAVCGSRRQAGSIVDGITTLVEMSLLTRENSVDATVEPRYQMLETVRDFAAEQLAERDDGSSVRDAHADWMMALTEEASARFIPRFRSPEAAVWLRRLTSEHDNLRAALAWLEERGRWVDLLRLTGAAVYFWELRLIPREGRTWLQRALNPERTVNAPSHLRARATSGLGLLLLRFGDYAAAEANLEDARVTFIELGDEDGAAFAQRMLAASAEYQGQEELAAARQLAALHLYRAAGDTLGISAVLDDLADGAYRRGDYDEAWRLANESVTSARIGESPIRLIGALSTAGEAATARGDLAQATVILHEGLLLAQDMGFELGIFGTVSGMAAVAAEAGANELAANLLGAATALADVRGLTTIPHHAQFRHTHATLKEVLGEVAFVAAWEAGRSLTPEQAVAEALAFQWETSAAPSDTLSPREREIFRLLAAGQTNRAIGEELFISERTVDSHVSRIFRKLDVRTRAEAIAVGSAPGWVAAPPSAPGGQKKHVSKTRQAEPNGTLEPDDPQRT